MNITTKTRLLLIALTSVSVLVMTWVDVRIGSGYSVDRGFWETFLSLIALAICAAVWIETKKSPFVWAARGLKQLHHWTLAGEAARIQFCRSVLVAAEHFTTNYPATAEDVMSREGIAR